MKAIKILLLALLVAAVPAFAKAQVNGVQGVAPVNKDIVETLTEAGRFNTLLQLLQAAGLTDALKGKGPNTILAPTDDAFAKLPAGTLEKLMAEPAKLREILAYHIAEGNYPASKLHKTAKLKMKDGNSVNISSEKGNILVNSARVVGTDIKANNGTIHVIDLVLMPTESKMGML